MQRIEEIFQRRSISRLTEPGPTPQQLAEILRSAAAAPDHGEMRPWRFVVIDGQDRKRLGEVLAGSARQRAEARGGSLSSEQVAKEEQKLFRAPTVVVVACVPQPGKIPEMEQVAAVAAATQNMLLAATAQGLGSMWRTGAPAEDPAVKEALGLDTADTIVGFVYLGTIPEGVLKAPRDPDAGPFVTHGLPYRNA